MDRAGDRPGARSHASSFFPFFEEVFFPSLSPLAGSIETDTDALATSFFLGTTLAVSQAYDALRT